MPLDFVTDERPVVSVALIVCLLRGQRPLRLTTFPSQVDCVEAIYNLGLVNIHLGLPGDSLQAFEKLHTIIPNNTEVIYHIANLYEVTQRYEGRRVCIRPRRVNSAF